MAVRTEHVSTSSHLNLTEREFERRLAAHGHAQPEIEQLWEELAATRDGEPPAGALAGLGPLIAISLGLLLVVVASVALVVVYRHDLGAGGILALALVYLAGYLVASEVLRRRNLALPADVLETVAPGWATLAAYAAMRLGDLWPTSREDLGVHGGFAVAALVALSVAAGLLALRPTPLLLLPAAAATAVIALDLSQQAFGDVLDHLNGAERIAFLLPTGIAWLAGGLALDAAGHRRYAAPVHWGGLAITGVAILTSVPKTLPGFALIGALGALSLFFSSLVRHWSYTVMGGLGVFTATVASMRLFGHLAPVVLAAVGLVLVFVGLRWSRWRDRIRAAVLDRAPAGVRGFVQRLAPRG